MYRILVLFFPFFCEITNEMMFFPSFDSNSMTAPVIPPGAIEDGETDMQVAGMLVHVFGCSLTGMFQVLIIPINKIVDYPTVLIKICNLNLSVI